MNVSLSVVSGYRGLFSTVGEMCSAEVTIGSSRNVPVSEDLLLIDMRGCGGAFAGTGLTALLSPSFDIFST